MTTLYAVVTQLLRALEDALRVWLNVRRMTRTLDRLRTQEWTAPRWWAQREVAQA